MILSGQTIRQRGMITPFHERTKHNGLTFGLGPAGYDVRIKESLLLDSGDQLLASTLEHITMPNDVLARVHDKSTWVREFITVQNTVIEPGWCGYLTLEIINHGRECNHIEAGDPIAQIIFERIDQPVEQPYNGKYQNQPSEPVQAIFDYAKGGA